MMDELKVTDLQAIRRLIEEAQQELPETGRHLLLWGIVLTVALIGTYANLNGSAVTTGWIWAVCVTAGWGIAVWLGRRGAARAPVHNLIQRVVLGIWIGMGVSASILAALSLYASAIRAAEVPGLISLVYGAGFFASSFAYRSTWFRVIALAWWLAGIAMLIWRGPHTILVLAGLVVAFNVVPGVVLLRRGGSDSGSAS